MPVSYLLYDGVAGWVVYGITYGVAMVIASRERPSSASGTFSPPR
jgi:hypothetical protein